MMLSKYSGSINALLLLDSDKRRKNDLINTTKQRLITEVEAFCGTVWLTAGREIENYIATEALSSLYSDRNLTPLKPYQDFAAYLNNIKADEGKRFRRRKVFFAEQVCPYLEKDSLMRILDLNDRLDAACKLIRVWNRL